MLSNEVVARARKLVGEHVLENLLAVSKATCCDVAQKQKKKTKQKKTTTEIHVLIRTLPFKV